MGEMVKKHVIRFKKKQITNETRTNHSGKRVNLQVICMMNKAKLRPNNEVRSDFQFYGDKNFFPKTDQL